MASHDPDIYSYKRLIYSVVTVLLLLLLPWGVEVYAWLADASVIRHGLKPWSFQGLLGILTMPFLHSGVDHLLSNSIPFFVLASGLFYFYRETAWKVLLWITLLTGIWLWFIGKPGTNHIGASGLVYGLASFHFTSGIIRKNRNLMAFALLVIFLYGGLIWSVFPDFFPDRNISWEGHLSGLVAGIVIAFVYRREGPLPDTTPFDDDEEEYGDDDFQGLPDDGENDDKDDFNNIDTTLSSGHPVRYHVI